MIEMEKSLEEELLDFGFKRVISIKNVTFTRIPLKYKCYTYKNDQMSICIFIYISLKNIWHNHAAWVYEEYDEGQLLKALCGEYQDIEYYLPLELRERLLYHLYEL